jgi:hypothetical protein
MHLLEANPDKINWARLGSKLKSKSILDIKDEST